MLCSNTDIFQQWHHAQSTSTISPAKCTAISTPATATMAKAAATTATAALNSANTRQSQQLKRKHTQTFIKLADESVTPTEIDESEYDSLNEQETGMLIIYFFFDFAVLSRKWKGCIMIIDAKLHASMGICCSVNIQTENNQSFFVIRCSEPH